MTFSEIEKNGVLYDQARLLRYRTFFLSLGLPVSILDDEFEMSSRHFAISNKSELLGCCRLSQSGSVFTISQVVVSPSCRGQGLGATLIKRVISKAIELGAKRIDLSARESAISFYQYLGFNPVGEHYHSSTTGVQHIKMVLDSESHIEVI